MKDYKSLYFVGAGGIGMAALERYFLAKGKKVAGYDRTPSELTQALEQEGVEIVYDENPDLIPSYCRDKDSTLVVYTPAVPSDHAGLCYFRDNGFEVVACQGAGYHHSRQQGFVLCRNAWQDHHVEHGGPHPAQFGCGVQCLPGRRAAQLRQQLPALVHKSLLGHRGRRV